MLQDKKPFTKALLSLIVAEQGGGKSTLLSARAVDPTFANLTSIVLVLGKKPDGTDRTFEVKASPALNDRGKPIIGYATIYLPDKEPFVAEIPDNGYAVAKDIKVFANYHLYGIRYMYVSLADVVQYIDSALFIDGIVNIDEGYIGAGNRGGMSSLGQVMTEQAFQLRKKRMHFNISYPLDKLSDLRFRLARTERITCSYDEARHEITAKIQRAKQKEKVITVDGSIYHKYFRTEERFKLLESKKAKAYQQAYDGG